MATRTGLGRTRRSGRERSASSKAEADTAYRPPPWSQEAVVMILLIECVRDADVEPDTGPVGQRNRVIGR